MEEYEEYLSKNTIQTSTRNHDHCISYINDYFIFLNLLRKAVFQLKLLTTFISLKN